jgi:acyl-homoserine lactone synthase
MIHVVTPENEHFYRDEMDQAYRLRHKVFVEEMGWKNMAKPDGREMDQFDTKHAVNMLYIEGGNVLGYQRLLPSTRPYLLSEVMPELCEVERPVGAHIWEVSRHCVAPGHRSGGNINGKAVMALTLTFDGRTLERLRELRGTRRRALVTTMERPALLHA